MKPFVKVHIVLHGMEDGEPWDFEDRIDDDGKFIPLGTQVAGMLENHESIFINGGFDPGEHIELLVPYHAIETYTIIKDSKEFTEPEDAFCDTGETAVERTITLSKIAESNQAYQSDVYFILGNMLPYMIGAGIEVKFMGNVVSSITSGQSTAEQVSWNVEDSNGTHVIAASITEDYDILGYPTVDGEEVDALSFTVGTDKRFVITMDNDEYYTEGLYSIGEVITVESDFVSYESTYPYDPNAEFQPLPANKTLPAVEDDSQYVLSRE